MCFEWINNKVPCFIHVLHRHTRRATKDNIFKDISFPGHLTNQNKHKFGMILHVKFCIFISEWLLALVNQNQIFDGFIAASHMFIKIYIHFILLQTLASHTVSLERQLLITTERSNARLLLSF